MRRFGEIEVSTHRFGGDARAVIIGETDGLVKLVSTADGTLVGVHVVGPVGDRAARRGVPVGELGGQRRGPRRVGAPAPDAGRDDRRGGAGADRPEAALMTAEDAGT